MYKRQGLDPQYLHPYMWTWKPHYYEADYAFYNFPYAFGLLLAKGLYGLYQKEGAAFSKTYENFLSLTGKMSICLLYTSQFMKKIMIHYIL